MARVLVHLHLFYEDQLDYFLEKLSNLNGCDWDLYVTYSSLSDLSRRKLTCFKPEVHLVEADNVGYDVWPFISLLKSIKIDAYDYVVKLHTKNLTGHIRLNGCRISSHKWRDMMVDSLLCCPDIFLSNLRRFDTDTSLGMLCNRVFYKNISNGSIEDLEMLENELVRLGITSDDRRFCAGTMFMARMAPFRLLCREDIVRDRFDAGISHSFGSLAHVYERVFGCIVTASGLRIGTVSTHPFLSLKAVIHDSLGPVAAWLFSVHRMGVRRDKYVTVLGRNIRMNPKRHFWVNLRIVLFGHILVAPWKNREQRRRTRGRVTRRAVCSYLNQYLPYIVSLKPGSLPIPDDGTEGMDPGGDRRLFSIWFQGEKNAPDVVRACFDSIRANCRQELVILDESNLSDYISLPDYIMEKWRAGKIRPAHFADICRVELLCRYGGIWLDATDFVSAPFPEWLWETPFFVYMSGDRQRGYYSFIQNCFIRADRSSFLIRAWRDLIFEYWREENFAVDYFVHQLLFRMLVKHNAAAQLEFEKMPSLSQDPAHVLWFENATAPYDRARFDGICAASLFQKTEYKSALAQRPPAGSMAEELVKRYSAERNRAGCQ